MASSVDICNLALSHIGSSATISSIAPPDGSVEAGRAARFYPIARRLLLTAINWSFATKRSTLATVTNPSETWGFAYALPSDCIKPIKVYAAGLEDTIEGGDKYEIEGDVILCNTEEAVLKYVRDVVDTTKFTPLFESAFSFMLASYMIGPTVKGADGANASVSLRQRAMEEASLAGLVDANASKESHGVHLPSHIKARQ